MHATTRREIQATGTRGYLPFTLPTEPNGQARVAFVRALLTRPPGEAQVACVRAYRLLALQPKPAREVLVAFVRVGHFRLALPTKPPQRELQRQERVTFVRVLLIKPPGEAQVACGRAYRLLALQPKSAPVLSRRAGHLLLHPPTESNRGARVACGQAYRLLALQPKPARVVSGRSRHSLLALQPKPARLR